MYKKGAIKFIHIRRSYSFSHAQVPIALGAGTGGRNIVILK